MIDSSTSHCFVSHKFPIKTLVIMQVVCVCSKVLQPVAGGKMYVDLEVIEYAGCSVCQVFVCHTEEKSTFRLKECMHAY